MIERLRGEERGEGSGLILLTFRLTPSLFSAAHDAAHWFACLRANFIRNEVIEFNLRRAIANIVT